MCVSKIHLFSLVPECSGVFCSVVEACSYSAGVGSISKTFGHEPQSFCLLTYLLLSCTSEKTARTHLNQCLGVKGRETGRGGRRGNLWGNLLPYPDPYCEESDSDSRWERQDETEDSRSDNAWQAAGKMDLASQARDRGGRPPWGWKRGSMCIYFILILLVSSAEHFPSGS